MKCDKCGYENSEFNINCDKCGSPLNIEKNYSLQKKYNHKPMAIDIERITPNYEMVTFKDTHRKVRIIVSLVIVLALFVSVYYLFSNIFFSKNDILKNVDKIFLENNMSIVYIGKDKDINENLTELLKKYEINYLYVNTSKIKMINKKKLKRILNINNIDSTIILIENGKIVDYTYEINNNNIENYLVENLVIPQDNSDVDVIKNNFNEGYNSLDSTIMYIANNKNSSNEKHNELIRNFCNNNDINYVFIEGYYLSNNQKIKLAKKINYNEIHDEFIVIIDNGKVIYESEFVNNNPNYYYELANSYGIIDTTSKNNLKLININYVNSILNKEETYILLIETKDCSYCDKVKPILGKLSIQNDINIYDYMLSEDDRLKLESLLISKGYKDKKITTPVVLIIDNKKIVDYLVGMTTRELYEEKFKQYGLIR